MSELNGTSIVSRIASYAQSLQIAGGLLTLLGLVPLIVDYVAPLTGREVNVPPWLTVAWFILCFSLANLRVFEAHAGRNVEFDVERYSFGLSEWLQSSKEGSLVPGTKPILSFSATLDIYNHSERPTHIKLEIESLDSDWRLGDYIVVGGMTTQVGYARADGSRHKGETIPLAGNEIITDAAVNASIPFSIPDTVQDFRHLGTMSRLSLALRVEQAGRKPQYLRFDCDVARFRKSLEQHLAQQVSGLMRIDTQRDPTLRVKTIMSALEIAKQLWVLDGNR